MYLFGEAFRGHKDVLRAAGYFAIGLGRSTVLGRIVVYETRFTFEVYIEGGVKGVGRLLRAGMSAKGHYCVCQPDWEVIANA